MFRLIILLTALCSISGNAFGQSLDFDGPPIQYAATESKDPIAQLISQIASGEIKLRHDADFGWLPSLLETLDIPVSSQLLVYSKTSLQIRKINPSNPRAIYFNDNIYVAYIPHADRIEVAAVDEDLGAVFYALEANATAEEMATAISRDNSCLSCHGTRKTQSVPGFLVRSVFATKTGQPRFEMGTTTTDSTTDFKDRFGGWYITGKHGDMRHRGNAFIDQKSTELDLDPGANLMNLPARVSDKRYLTQSSDIVAMMVLEHQAQMHNAITKAAYTARQTKHQDDIMNEVLERDADFVSASTKRQIKSAGDNLIDHLLFKNEFQLTSAIKGSSSFKTEFEKLGPFDEANRSLRQFDLERRMFKFPCSYLIYSSSFDALPQPILDYVLDRLHTILKNDSNGTGDFAYLDRSDRLAIFEILTATKPAFGKWSKN